MSTKATVRQAGDVSIVDLAGRITLGEGSGLVRSTIKDLVTAGRKNILLILQVEQDVLSTPSYQVFDSASHQSGAFSQRNAAGQIDDRNVPGLAHGSFRAHSVPPPIIMCTIRY